MEEPEEGGITFEASACTSSGKTAAFALPILNRLSEDTYGVFALVVTPTRELADSSRLWVPV
uniref:DEAD/DEAH-box helicase domain-containing protein n=1 Tax=Brassica campestris TaxID=3711 RepID=M4EBB2_BRACM